MAKIVTRRALLAGAGYATAAYGALATRVLSLAEAEEAQPKPAAPMLSMSMVFVSDAKGKSKLDAKKMTDNHLPLLRKLYGDSVERIELRIGQSPASGMFQTSILGMVYILIKDPAAFAKALSVNSRNINLDLDVAAQGARYVQVDRVVFTGGDALSEVKVGHQLLTVFFPANPMNPTEKFDADYFKSRHVPSLVTLYTLSTARRVEGLLGQDQGDKARNKGTVNVHLRDRVAYDRVAVSAMGDLIEDAKKFTTIIPEFNELRVQAIV